MEGYVPISGEMQRHIFDTIAGVIMARGQAGAAFPGQQQRIARVLAMSNAPFGGKLA